MAAVLHRWKIEISQGENTSTRRRRRSLVAVPQILRKKVMNVYISGALINDYQARLCVC